MKACTWVLLVGNAYSLAGMLGTSLTTTLKSHWVIMLCIPCGVLRTNCFATT